MNDPQGFLAHLREEANNGNGEALHDLGQIYAAPQLAQQFGIEVDQRQAVEYWRRGADLGNALCQANFGSRLVRGYGVEMDEAAGFRYYKLAADQGSLEGLFGGGLLRERRGRRGGPRRSMALDELSTRRGASEWGPRRLHQRYPRGAAAH